MRCIKSTRVFVYRRDAEGAGAQHAAPLRRILRPYLYNFNHKGYTAAGQAGLRELLFGGTI